MMIAMCAIQTWDPKHLCEERQVRSDLASPVLDLLSAQPGERIFDLGCGDGVLTNKLAQLGGEAVS
jgi:trans-aconitate methyltransferase